MKPQKIDDLTIIFPAIVIGTLLPEYEDIPDEFKNRHHPWAKVQEKWFFKGVKEVVWTPKEGIDTDTAIRHLKACQGSFQPKDEHKQAGVAYLMSLWFERVEYDGAPSFA